MTENNQPQKCGFACRLKKLGTSAVSTAKHYAPAVKNAAKTAGSVAYNAGKRMYQNQQAMKSDYAPRRTTRRNAPAYSVPEGYELVRTAPKTTRRPTHSVPEGYELVRTAPKTTRRPTYSVPEGYELVRSAPKKKAKKPSVPKGYRLVRTAPKKAKKPKAPKGYRLVRTAPKKAKKQKAPKGYKYVRM